MYFTAEKTLDNVNWSQFAAGPFKSKGSIVEILILSVFFVKNMIL